MLSVDLLESRCFLRSRGGQLVSTLNHLSDMRKMIILRTIIESGSLRKAASQLKVTPSAVSQTLASLEKKIGKPMIIRERGQFKVTKECEELIAKFNPALKAIDAFSLETTKQQQMVRLDLGTFESLAIDVLPQLISTLREDHPKCRLNLIIARSGIILQKLRSGELCTGLVVETEGIENFNTHVVAEDELGLFATPGSQDDWSTVESLGLGTMVPGIEGYPGYFSKFTKSLGNIKPILTSDSFEVLRVAALSGNLVSVLPKKLANRIPGQLQEITARPKGSTMDSGKHKVVIAYLERCDEQEAKYLAEIVQRVYG